MLDSASTYSNLSAWRNGWAALRRFASKALSGAFAPGSAALRGSYHAHPDVSAALVRAQRVQKTLLEAIDLLPEGLVILDAERRYVAWNRQYETIYSGTADCMKVGEKLEDAVRIGIRRGEYPEAVGREEEWLAERLRRLAAPGPRHEQILADGRCILIEDTPTSDGGIVSLRVDITEMKQREASFRLLFDSNPMPMFVCDRATWSISAVNDAAVRHYGFTRKHFASMTFADIHCAVEPAALDGWRASGAVDALGRYYKHVRRDGSIIEVELRTCALVHDAKPCVLVAVIDITERRRNEFRVTHMARHDVLTNLPNRMLLAERMELALAHVSEGRSAALLFLDLDDFKIVNDTMGHAAGDMLLKEIASRLSSCVRASDTVARLGGDEFAVLLAGDAPRCEVTRVCERILEAMATPIATAGKDVTVGVSVGIAMAPDDATTADELFRCSDLAMYAAKDDGRGKYRFFDREMDESMRARTSLEAELAHAIAHGELELHYQPLLSLEAGTVSCMEALVRWRHPVRGLVPPVEFIPIAEESGMILALGEYVLRQACIDAVAWPEGVKVAVNVSALELESPEFLDKLAFTLELTGLPPGRLQIEVTETAVMSNIDRSIALLKEIRARGVEIAMDDFGTGYSSLSFLRSFPFDKIKIDRAFIRDSSESAEGRAILSAIVALARSLRMATTAEGVETAEQLDIVKGLGCTEIQGYLLSPPKPLSALSELMAAARGTVQHAA